MANSISTALFNYPNQVNRDEEMLQLLRILLSAPIQQRAHFVFSGFILRAGVRYVLSKNEASFTITEDYEVSK